MNYLIKICIILLYSQSINANNTIENKILFKINDKVFTNIDFEKRKEYIAKVNNITQTEFTKSENTKIEKDYISALIFYEYYSKNKISY